MRKRIAIDSLLIIASIVIYVASIVVAQTISYILGSAFTMGLRIVSILLMLLVVLKRSISPKKRTKNRKRNKYLILAILYNNLQI